MTNLRTKIQIVLYWINDKRNGKSVIGRNEKEENSEKGVGVGGDTGVP